METFDSQAAVLSDRFIENGYDQTPLSQLVRSTRETERASLLGDRVGVTADKVSLPFFTTFTIQHQSIKRLIQKHWHILESDQLLSTVLPARPQIVFKRASSLSNRIAPSVQDPPQENRCFFQNLTAITDAKTARCVHQHLAVL